MSTLRELHKKGISVLKKGDSPSLEARLMLLKAVGISEEKFYSEPELEVPLTHRNKYFRMLEERQKGVPLAYLTGKKEFWSMNFKVGKGVLIPRPETEGLVERIIELHPDNKGLIIDMGTGCGSIALAAARELPGSQVLGIDISDKAVEYAQKNALLHNIRNVRFIQGDLFAPLKKSEIKKRCGIIVSNPPYVSEKEWIFLEPQIRKYEPKSALVSDRNGYGFIHRLVLESLEYLMPGGHLIFEMGRGQKDTVRTFFDEQWRSVECRKDLAGIPRIFIAKKREKKE